MIRRFLLVSLAVGAAAITGNDDYCYLGTESVNTAYSHGCEWGTCLTMQDCAAECDRHAGCVGFNFAISGNSHRCWFATSTSATKAAPWTSGKWAQVWRMSKTATPVECQGTESITGVELQLNTGCPGPSAVNQAFMAQTITMPTEGTVYVSVSVIAAIYARADIGLYMDGAIVSRMLRHHSPRDSDSWENVEFAYAGYLSTGTHTFDVRPMNTGGANVWGCGEGWGRLVVSGFPTASGIVATQTTSGAACHTAYAAGGTIHSKTVNVGAEGAYVFVHGTGISHTAGRSDISVYIDGVERSRSISTTNDAVDDWTSTSAGATQYLGQGSHSISLRAPYGGEWQCGNEWGALVVVVMKANKHNRVEFAGHTKGGCPSGTDAGGVLVSKTITLSRETFVIARYQDIRYANGRVDWIMKVPGFTDTYSMANTDQAHWETAAATSGYLMSAGTHTITVTSSSSSWGCGQSYGRLDIMVLGGDTASPTASPTDVPTKHPTSHPTGSPTRHPTSSPTLHPTSNLPTGPGCFLHVKGGVCTGSASHPMLTDYQFDQYGKDHEDSYYTEAKCTGTRRQRFADYCGVPLSKVKTVWNDPCLADAAAESSAALSGVAGKASGQEGQAISFSDFDFASAGAKCTGPAHKGKVAKKRKAAFKAALAVVSSFQVIMAEAGMPSKFVEKTTGKYSELKVRKSAQKTKNKVSASGQEQCTEADVDLINPGAYDVVLEADGDEALACLGKRPIAILAYVAEGTYSKLCWDRADGSWGPAAQVVDGDEFVCSGYDFFVQSMAVVSDGATDAPTSSPTLGPTPDWSFMQFGDLGKAVQCGDANMIVCASDDGVNCNNYTGTAWESVGTNDAPIVSNDSPKEMACPGWISAGVDPCTKLGCYLTAQTLSGGADDGVHTTDYNMGIADDDKVYKCNSGHRKCMVNTPQARFKFVEVPVADVPAITMVPAENFSANATDGSFSIEGNRVVYVRSDERLKHKIPFADDAQQ